MLPSLATCDIIAAFDSPEAKEVMCMGEPEHLTAAQAGELLHMRADSVTRRIRRGQLPAVKVGRQWLIRRETLEAMLRPSTLPGQV
jgi:excisionase family DNA binding protein